MDEEEISILMNGPAMFVILDRDGRKAQRATENTFNDRETLIL
jgi:hypothetical protein